jgi:hypothetical protein
MAMMTRVAKSKEAMEEARVILTEVSSQNEEA